MNSFTEIDRENTTPEQSIVETTIDPWQKLQNGFKGIRLLKNATRILEIRNNAQQLRDDYSKQIATLDSQYKQLSDPLVKLSAQQKITELKQKISAIDTNLAGITSRVTELVKESKTNTNS